MTVLAIDPGNAESAYCLIDADLRPARFEKLTNDGLLLRLRGDTLDGWGVADRVAVEMVASYGMSVGRDVFETCVWVGRFAEAIERGGRTVDLITRHPVKLHHCHNGGAKDSNIKQALVDRFACGVRNHGKGTKDQPGWFYGFHRDIWQAYALAVYVADQAGVLA